MKTPLDWIRSPSAPTIHERLLAEVIEQNRLLRIDLASRGVAPSRLSLPQTTQVTPRRKLTEADVTVVTRADLLRQQYEDEERAARALPDGAPTPAPSVPSSSPSGTPSA